MPSWRPPPSSGGRCRPCRPARSPRRAPPARNSRRIARTSRTSAGAPPACFRPMPSGRLACWETTSGRRSTSTSCPRGYEDAHAVAARRHPLAEDRGTRRARRSSFTLANYVQLPRLAGRRGAPRRRGRPARHPAAVPACARRDARRAGPPRRRLRPRPRLRHGARGVSRQGRRQPGRLREPGAHGQRQPAPAPPLCRAAQAGARACPSCASTTSTFPSCPAWPAT